MIAMPWVERASKAEFSAVHDDPDAQQSRVR